MQVQERTTTGGVASSGVVVVDIAITNGMIATKGFLNAKTRCHPTERCE